MLNKFHKMGSYNVYRDILKNLNKIDYAKQYETRDMKLNKININYFDKQNEITKFINNNKLVKRPEHLKLTLTELIQSNSVNMLHKFSYQIIRKINI